MEAIQFILPQCSDDEVSELLRSLTEAIESKGNEISHGFLGGSHGYGAHFQNETFVMRPFYWGDCDCGYVEKAEAWSDTHKHSDECYQSQVDRDLERAGWTRNKWGYLDSPENLSYEEKQIIESDIRQKWCLTFVLSFPYGCAVHCTCQHDLDWQEFIAHNQHLETCSAILPNFHHFTSGVKIEWYKYIGRDNKIENPNNADVALILREAIASVGQAQ